MRDAPSPGAHDNVPCEHDQHQSSHAGAHDDDGEVLVVIIIVVVVIIIIGIFCSFVAVPVATADVVRMLEVICKKMRQIVDCRTILSGLYPALISIPIAFLDSFVSCTAIPCERERRTEKRRAADRRKEEQDRDMVDIFSDLALRYQVHRFGTRSCRNYFFSEVLHMSSKRRF